MHGHFRNVCQYGTTHSQCRCIGGAVSIRKINCPTPDLCGRKYQPKHRKDVEPKVVLTDSDVDHNIDVMESQVVTNSDGALATVKIEHCGNADDHVTHYYGPGSGTMAPDGSERPICLGTLDGQQLGV